MVRRIEYKVFKKIILTLLYVVESFAGGIDTLHGGLTNYCPSVLWHCWLGHLTHKMVPDMTYNVFGGTLNRTESINHAVMWTVERVYVWLCYSGMIRATRASQRARHRVSRPVIIYLPTSNAKSLHDEVSLTHTHLYVPYLSAFSWSFTKGAIQVRFTFTFIRMFRVNQQRRWLISKSSFIRQCVGRIRDTCSQLT